MVCLLFISKHGYVGRLMVDPLNVPWKLVLGSLDHEGVNY